MVTSRNKLVTARSLCKPDVLAHTLQYVSYWPRIRQCYRAGDKDSETDLNGVGSRLKFCVTRLKFCVIFLRKWWPTQKKSHGIFSTVRYRVQLKHSRPLWMSCAPQRAFYGQSLCTFRSVHSRVRLRKLHNAMIGHAP
jgi:hypothetical protein